MDQHSSYTSNQINSSKLVLPSFSAAHILSSSARFVLISDTHGQHQQICNIPEGDVLVHAGDCCGKVSVEWEPTLRKAGNSLIEFLRWFGAFPHPIKILVAGNHDTPFTGIDFITGKPLVLSKEAARQCCSNAGVIYLEDQELLIDRLRVYGTPWQPPYKNLAFNAEDDKRKAIFGNIPEGIDVLVTHTPARGNLDLNEQGEHIGCEILKSNISRTAPRLHVFGHVHNSAGKHTQNDLISVNASSVGKDMAIVNSPMIVDLDV